MECGSLVRGKKKYYANSQVHCHSSVEYLIQIVSPKMMSPAQTSSSSLIG